MRYFQHLIVRPLVLPGFSHQDFREDQRVMNGVDWIVILSANFQKNCLMFLLLFGHLADMAVELPKALEGGGLEGMTWTLWHPVGTSQKHIHHRVTLSQSAGLKPKGRVRSW